MGFKIVKHFKLDFLGEEWKDAYLKLRPFTVQDIKVKLPKIAEMSNIDSKELKESERSAITDTSMEVLVEMIQDKFVSGKGVDDDGTLVDITKETLLELPLEVITTAFSFLSNGEETQKKEKEFQVEKIEIKSEETPSTTQ